jgi:hypothetical protein
MYTYLLAIYKLFSEEAYRLFIEGHSSYLETGREYKVLMVSYTSYSGKCGECMLFIRDCKLFREKWRIHAIHEGLHITQAIHEKEENACFLLGNTHYTSYSGKRGECMLFTRDYTLHKLFRKS